MCWCTQLYVRYGSSGKKWGKQVCVIKQGSRGQWLQQTSLISDNVEEMIQEYCEIKQKDTDLKLGISKERVGHIINQLEFWKLWARWVPWKLTDKMKAGIVRVLRDFLCLLRQLRQIVTNNEILVHHYVLTNTRQWMENRHKGPLTPKKSKHKASSKNVIFTVFWNPEGVVLTDFWQNVLQWTQNMILKH